MIRAILFDLDGTLLPMDNEEFLRVYLARVGRSIPEQDAKMIAKYIMEATMQVMRRNGDGETNAEMFARLFCGMTGLEPDFAFEHFARFYEQEFPKLRALFPPEPRVREILDLCAAKRFLLALATVPLFPRIATHERLAWAGGRPEEFALCACYEDFSTCKPNPAYYLDIAARLGCAPGECLMVGNDARDDIAPATAAGMQAFFLTNHAIGDAEDHIPRGDYHTLFEMIQSLPDGVQ